MNVKYLSIPLILFFSYTGFAQPPGYYNGTSGLKGEALKTELHEIINDHIDFSYSQARYLINYSDADPENENNVILFYTQRSQDADSYGTDGDQINREHVWAKSHGDFSGIRPMDGDAFNLQPADASVNMDRSNKDFGIVQPNGNQHPEATECWYNASTWEPGDATKGQVARILFYMATRYEGTSGEIDLEVVNGVNTYPQPKHGDLSALLEWNRQFPPTDFERRRNERLFTIQQNRNPFIDNPELADIIWANADPALVQFDSLSLSPNIPVAGKTAQLSFQLISEMQADELFVAVGETFNSEDQIIELDNTLTEQLIELDFTTFDKEQMVYIKLVAVVDGEEYVRPATIDLPRNVNISQLTTVAEVQGTANESPMLGQKVIIAGRVVANLDNSIYIQNGSGKYSGLCIFGSNKTGYVGDSVIIEGEVVEYSGLTELSNVSYFYNVKSNKPYEPTVLKVDEVGEDYEGMLVTIKDVSFANAGDIVPDENASYSFGDETGNMTIFSRYGSRLVGKTIPYGVVDVTGVVSQYNDDYQILVRNVDDFTQGNDTIAPEVTNVTILDKDWITVDFSERVDQATSEQIENYVFSSGITVLSAYRYSEATTVILNVEGLSVGTHTLTVNGVSDQMGNAIDNQTIEFESIVSKVDALMGENMRIYPNPSIGGVFTIETIDNIQRIEVYDFSGQVISVIPFNVLQGSISVSSIPGIYVLNIITDQTKYNKKVVVQ
ncbi:MAG: endonuclease [Prolixibacteraceae bacterium]|jgi:endonuclease I/DNA/RNA endonuclease YhcR with UshA esterase domain|nr:endonuclease [Prolixibacteraceae bacterium]